MDKVNLFSQKKQLNARLDGDYWKIAGKVNEEKCVFCDLKDKYIIKREKDLVLTVNLFPYIDGQLLIVPIRHVENFSQLNINEIKQNFDLTKLGMRLLRQEIKVRGIWVILRDGNLGSQSGKTVKHLHWNIMPYEEGINTWHYQKITIPPIDLADKLRRKL